MTSTFVSYVAADSVVTGPVPLDPFVPGSPNLFPKMVNRINDSAWELWQFDAFNTESATSVSFYRDARGIKEGGFHVDLNAVWPDGSTWGKEIYFAESIITSEGNSPESRGRVHGLWTSGGGSVSEELSTAEFSIAADLSTATVRFRAPGSVEGTIHLHLLGGDRQARLPKTEDVALLGPSVYYIFPMGPVAATAHLAFEIVDEASGTAEKRKLSMRKEDGARGGMVRGWSARAWPQIMTDAYYLCATAGPYMLQLLRIISSAADGWVPHIVARLYRDDELVCAAQHVVDAESQNEESVSIQDVVAIQKMREEGGLSGAFRDKNTGYLIDFIQGTRQQCRKQWRFEVRHKIAWWSNPTSAPGPNGTGKSGFVEGVLGGSDGETRFVGGGASGQLQLP
jgi:hypothetical protein